MTSQEDLAAYDRYLDEADFWRKYRQENEPNQIRCSRRPELPANCDGGFSDGYLESEASEEG